VSIRAYRWRVARIVRLAPPLIVVFARVSAEWGGDPMVLPHHDDEALPVEHSSNMPEGEGENYPVDSVASVNANGAGATGATGPSTPSGGTGATGAGPTGATGPRA
jgi:hypothetical protein